MNNGYLKVAAAMPQVFVGGIFQNTQNIKKLIIELNALQVDIAVFPEMCLYGSSQSSIAAQNTLINDCEDALMEIAQFTKNRQVLCVIGLPLRVEDKILNCAAMIGMGKVWSIIYKSDQKYNFDNITLGDYSIPFSNKALMRCNSDLPINLAIVIGKDINNIFSTSANIVLNPFSADLEIFDNYYDQIKILSQNSPKAIISVCGTICKTPYADKSSIIAECGQILSKGVNQPIITAEIDIEKITGLRTIANQTFSLKENYFIELPLDQDTNFVRKRSYPRLPYANTNNFEKIYQRLTQILYELSDNTKKKIALSQGEHFWMMLSLLLDMCKTYALKSELITLLLDNKDQDTLISNSGFEIQTLKLDEKSQNIKNAYIIDWAQDNDCILLGSIDRTDYLRHRPCNAHFVNPLINFNKTAIYIMLAQRRKYDNDWANILEQYQPKLDDIIIDFFVYHYIDCGLSAQKTKQIAYETFEDIKKIQDLWDEFVVTI